MLQVGLRSENIMITHPDSAAYRPTLAHSPPLPEAWPTTRPTPREPATSARGAPSVFRHPSTGSHPSPAAPPADPFLTSPTRTKRASSDTPPIRLRSLSHILELAQDDASHPPPTPARRNRSGYTDHRRYEISSMPVGDVIEMVAGLLTKITTTNDRQHEALSRSMPPPSSVSDGGAGATTTTNSVLAFHGKNVPSITIMSYLSRIHKYCPTTYEVFLSLLVYFDRMTESVNKRSNGPQAGSGSVSREEREAPIKEIMVEEGERHVFVVDSFNIHRLVIAGVTCASKFFSDVFYTNSRYAKVGGLPLQELNHLELQFLILNDFRLSVPVEELEAYGTMLVQFYAREAIANTNLRTQSSLPPPSPAQQPDPEAPTAA